MQEQKEEHDKIVYDVQIVAYPGDDYMRLLREGYEIIDRDDKNGKRTMRKPKEVPFAVATL